jgi:hypothetical protein
MDYFNQVKIPIAFAGIAGALIFGNFNLILAIHSIFKDDD